MKEFDGSVVLGGLVLGFSAGYYFAFRSERARMAQLQLDPAKAISQKQRSAVKEGEEETETHRTISFKTAAHLVMAIHKRFRSLSNLIPDLALTNASNKHLAHSTKIFKIVLTGGPCGGKTSSLNHFTKKLTEKGFAVYTTPEVPTILINGGCAYPGAESPATVVFESQLISLQLQLEDSFVRIAEATGKPSVIVYDRGVMDAAAYLNKDLWNNILTKNKWEEAKILGRYDLVLHLVTAADGAEDYYTTTNNAARRETPDEARWIDNALRTAWKKHPNLVIVKNDGPFSSKLETATNSVLSMIGDTKQE